MVTLFQVPASSAVGFGLFPSPPLDVPLPKSPDQPLFNGFEVVNSIVIEVVITPPESDGGPEIDGNMIKWDTADLEDGIQAIALICPFGSEVQTITTVVADANEIQYILQFQKLIWFVPSQIMVGATKPLGLVFVRSTTRVLFVVDVL